MKRLANRHYQRRAALLITTAFAIAASPLFSRQLFAAESKDFSLDVSPATISQTVKPGTKTDVELRIKNTGPATEKLKIETRAIRVGTGEQNVSLSDATPPDLAQWISFDHPTFEIKPGAWFTERISINLPEAAGFSYPFAVVISRVDEKAVATDGRLIKGSVAVFALINVDKPGATRKFEIEDFSMSKKVYDYLPAEIDLKLRNTGNTIVQPYGNFYVQRTAKDTDPISVLPLNVDRGYILPGSVRTFKAVWNDGFHRYETASPNGKVRENLTWDWNSLSKIRIGKYTTRVVAVYNDGQRDVPVVGEVSFWVFPWKFVIVLLIVVLLIIFGLRSVIRGSIRSIRRLSARFKRS
jgi:hypothetical protein